jgi:hypothetical protein
MEQQEIIFLLLGILLGIQITLIIYEIKSK